MSGEGRVVCVTGGSGYLASWIIHHLLQRGFTVKATLRNPSDPEKTEHLFALDGAKERLQLFKANLLEEGSFDQAVEGCEGVFHTASPVILSSDDPQAELIDPALKGTLNVLKSCTKVPTIKRVVITSSITAVLFNGKPLTPDVVVDETWFSDSIFCQEKKLWYPLSKALAEDAAWKFAKENKIDMVTMNPGFVLGPLLLPSLSVSVEIVLKHINAGAKTFPNDYMRFVDVRDIANAHILAFERPSASGRYCLVANVEHFSELLKIVHENYPTLQLPEKCAENPFVSKYDVSKERAKSLGVDFISLEITVKDTIESLKEKGFLIF